MKRCPVCGRHGWFTEDSVADHIERDHPHVLGLCRKVRYRTSADALDALISANRKPREKRREHRRYLCTKCAGYHLTSQPLGAKP